MIDHHRPWRIVALILGSATAVLLFGALLQSSLASPEQVRAASAQVPIALSEANCRYGAAFVWEFAGSDAWIPTLGAGWYMTAAAWPAAVPPENGAEFVHVVRVRQDIVNGQRLPTYRFEPALTDAELGQLINANPGRLWLIGNEPEVGNVVQDNTMPAVYARAYHDAYHFIKQRDLSAQVGIAGLSMMTPGRLQYLDIVWSTYLQTFGGPMPVDVWNMHLYVLSEIRPWDNGPSDGKVALGTDPAVAIKAPAGNPASECPRDDVYCRAEHDDITIFAQQVRNMRTWMKAHGQQNKPLILSEYSILYPFVDYDDPVHPTQCFLMDEFQGCFTPDRVSSFMRATFDFLENARDPALGLPYDDNRLVQQWLWYSLRTWEDNTGGASSLLLPDYQNFAPGSTAALSPMGQTYRAEVLARERYLNLTAVAVDGVAGYVPAGGGSGTAELRITFANNGNLALAGPFDVTFYADEALSQAIGSATIQPPLNGCARVTGQAATVWRDLPPGTHPFWVKLDSRDSVVERDESTADNVARGTVTIYSESAFLPVGLR